MSGLQKKEFEFLNKHYCIGEVKRVQKVERGVMSNNMFIFTHKGKFFLKQNRKEVALMMSKIESAEDFFAQGGFPVLLPILSKKGQKHIKYKGNLFTLYPYIDEKVIDIKNLTAEHLYNLGKLLARMHNYSIKNKNDYKESSVSKDECNKEKAITKLNEILNIIKENSSKDSKTYEKSINLKNIYIKNNSPACEKLRINDFFLVHGDFHSNNVFFNKKKEIVSIFDFGKTKVASITVEFARAAFLICFNHSYSASNFKRFQFFLSGYSSERKISNTFIKKGFSIVMDKLFYSSWFEQERFIKGNTRLDELFIESSKSLKYLSVHKKEFFNKILS